VERYAPVVGGSWKIEQALPIVGKVASGELVFLTINLGKFHHDLTGLPSPGIMVNKGNHPQMAQQFRLVKYYGLYPDQ